MMDISNGWFEPINHSSLVDSQQQTYVTKHDLELLHKKIIATDLIVQKYQDSNKALSRLQHENDDLRLQIDQITNECCIFGKQVTESTQECDHLKEQIEILNTEKRELCQRIRQLQDENTNYYHEVMVLKQYESLKETNDKLSKEFERQQKFIAKLQLQLQRRNPIVYKPNKSLTEPTETDIALEKSQKSVNELKLCLRRIANFIKLSKIEIPTSLYVRPVLKAYDIDDDILEIEGEILREPVKKKPVSSESINGDKDDNDDDNDDDDDNGDFIDVPNVSQPTSVNTVSITATSALEQSATSSKTLNTREKSKKKEISEKKGKKSSRKTTKNVVEHSPTKIDELASQLELELSQSDRQPEERVSLFASLFSDDELEHKTPTKESTDAPITFQANETHHRIEPSKSLSFSNYHVNEKPWKTPTKQQNKSTTAASTNLPAKTSPYPIISSTSVKSKRPKSVAFLTDDDSGSDNAHQQGKSTSIKNSVHSQSINDTHHQLKSSISITPKSVEFLSDDDDDNVDHKTQKPHESTSNLISNNPQSTDTPYQVKSTITITPKTIETTTLFSDDDTDDVLSQKSSTVPSTSTIQVQPATIFSTNVNQITPIETSAMNRPVIYQSFLSEDDDDNRSLASVTSVHTKQPLIHRNDISPSELNKSNILEVDKNRTLQVRSSDNVLTSDKPIETKSSCLQNYSSGRQCDRTQSKIAPNNLLIPDKQTVLRLLQFLIDLPNHIKTLRPINRRIKQVTNTIPLSSDKNNTLNLVEQSLISSENNTTTIHDKPLSENSVEPMEQSDASVITLTTSQTNSSIDQNIQMIEENNSTSKNITDHQQSTMISIPIERKSDADSMPMEKVEQSLIQKPNIGHSELLTTSDIRIVDNIKFHQDQNLTNSKENNETLIVQTDLHISTQSSADNEKNTITNIEMSDIQTITNSIENNTIACPTHSQLLTDSDASTSLSTKISEDQPPPIIDTINFESSALIGTETRKSSDLETIAFQSFEQRTTVNTIGSSSSLNLQTPLTSEIIARPQNTEQSTLPITQSSVVGLRKNYNETSTNAVDLVRRTTSTIKSKLNSKFDTMDHRKSLNVEHKQVNRKTRIEEQTIITRTPTRQDKQLSTSTETYNTNLISTSSKRIQLKPNQSSIIFRLLRMLTQLPVEPLHLSDPLDPTQIKQQIQIPILTTRQKSARISSSPNRMQTRSLTSIRSCIARCNQPKLSQKRTASELTSLPKIKRFKTKLNDENNSEYKLIHHYLNTISNTEINDELKIFLDKSLNENHSNIHEQLYQIIHEFLLKNMNIILSFDKKLHPYEESIKLLLIYMNIKSKFIFQQNFIKKLNETFENDIKQKSINTNRMKIFNRLFFLACSIFKTLSINVYARLFDIAYYLLRDILIDSLTFISNTCSSLISTDIQTNSSNILLHQILFDIFYKHTFDISCEYIENLFIAYNRYTHDQDDLMRCFILIIRYQSWSWMSNDLCSKLFFPLLKKMTDYNHQRIIILIVLQYILFLNKDNENLKQDVIFRSQIKQLLLSLKTMNNHESIVRDKIFFILHTFS